MQHLQRPEVAIGAQEDSIIFALIERAQFAHNARVYQPGAVPVPSYRPDGEQHSLLEVVLREMEQLHGRYRRYTSPDEQAFYPDDLPPLVLQPIQYQQVRPLQGQGWSWQTTWSRLVKLSGLTRPNGQAGIPSRETAPAPAAAPLAQAAAAPMCPPRRPAPAACAAAPPVPAQVLVHPVTDLSE